MHYWNHKKRMAFIRQSCLLLLTAILSVPLAWAVDESPSPVSDFQIAIEKGLAPGGSLQIELRKLDETTLLRRSFETEADIKSFMRALQAVPQLDHQQKPDWKGVECVLLYAPSETIEPNLIQLVTKKVTPELLRLTRTLQSEPPSESRDELLLFALEVASRFPSSESTTCIAQTAKLNTSPDNHNWRHIFDLYDKRNDLFSAQLVREIGNELPTDTLAESYLAFCNSIAERQDDFQHPFNCEKGADRLRDMLKGTEELLSIRTAALPQIDRQFAEPILKQVIDMKAVHRSPLAAMVAASRDFECGWLALQEFCNDLLHHAFAAEHLESLGRTDLIPEAVRTTEFRVRSEFTIYFSKNLFIDPIEKSVEIIAHRDWTWPNEDTTTRMNLIRYFAESGDRLNPYIAIGFHRRDSASFLDRCMDLWTPEDCFARHCGAELTFEFSDNELQPPEEIPADWNNEPLELVHGWSVRRMRKEVEYPSDRNGLSPIVSAAAAICKGQRGFAVFDGPRSEWYDQGHFPSHFQAEDVLDIHIGRVMLGLPHRIQSSLDTKHVYPDDLVIEVYEQWLTELESGSSDGIDALFSEGFLLSKPPISREFDRYLDAITRVSGGSRSKHLFDVYERILKAAAKLEPEQTSSAFDPESLLVTHFESFVTELSKRDVSEARDFLTGVEHFMNKEGSRLPLARAAMSIDLPEIARNHFEMACEENPAKAPLEMAQIWHQTGHHREAKLLLENAVRARGLSGPLARRLACRKVEWTSLDRARAAAKLHLQLYGEEPTDCLDDPEFRKIVLAP